MCTPIPHDSLTRNLTNFNDAYLRPAVSSTLGSNPFCQESVWRLAEFKTRLQVADLTTAIRCQT